jgi:hypothetical protein
MGIAKTWKTFTLKVIVQGLFWIYNEELNFDPLKIKDQILMTFIGKVVFNIGGLTYILFWIWVLAW